MNELNELVDVYVKTADKWELLYKDISEDIATELWLAGFRTGKNLISIERKADTEFFERQLKKLRQV